MSRTTTGICLALLVVDTGPRSWGLWTGIEILVNNMEANTNQVQNCWAFLSVFPPAARRSMLCLIPPNLTAPVPNLALPDSARLQVVTDTASASQQSCRHRT